MSTTTPPLILVVEDETALLGDIVEELQEAGYRTLAAPDGLHALALLGEAVPDLVLCDITMPGLDGYDLLATIRRDHPELAATPFVFLTALSEPREVVEGKRMGADDYLVKPVDYDLMLATIAARLRQVDRMHHRHGREITALRHALSGFSGGGAERALDLIALGIILLDAEAHVVHANRAASEMAEEGDFFTIRAGQVVSSEALPEKALRGAISDILTAARAGAEKLIGVALRRAMDELTMSALVSALPRQGTHRPGAPLAAIFLSIPQTRQHVPPSLLAELFGLTPTEARIAAALASNARTSELAADLGVSQSTIAFHMRNLFEKTGTNRQADLIALILAGPMLIKTG